MSLIIFSKKQQVTPERFGLSIVCGALVLLVLGALYGKLHNTQRAWPADMSIDIPMIVIAFAVAICIGFIYFRQSGDQSVVKVNDVLSENENSFFDESLRPQIARVLQLIPLGNAALLLAGLYLLVWDPVQMGYDMVSQLGLIALYSVVFLLPLNYAARLHLESYLDTADLVTKNIAWQRYQSILYWVLVCYWGALFASYVTLLLHSSVYCRPWFGC